MNILKSNFQTKEEVKPEEKKPDPNAEYQKKALESIGGSMVFVERKQLYFDPK